ncbi:MAG: RNA polymerase sigma factor, partial [Clostridia bacterium]|nr:RNA polymerase sigma factor [Clostridia bacterium]
MDNGASSYRRFLAGDDDGLAEIIRDYRDGLIFYLNGFVNNIHSAEDMAEDVFVKIAVKKPHFKGTSSFKTWLYAIGRNEAYGAARRRKIFYTPLNELAAHEDYSVSPDSSFLKK